MSSFHRFQKSNINLIRQGLVQGIMLQDLQVGAQLESPNQGVNTIWKSDKQEIAIAMTGKE